jgi:hypothetical protein
VLLRARSPDLFGLFFLAGKENRGKNDSFRLLTSALVDNLELWAANSVVRQTKERIKRKSIEEEE